MQNLITMEYTSLFKKKEKKISAKNSYTMIRIKIIHWNRILARDGCLVCLRIQCSLSDCRLLFGTFPVAHFLSCMSYCSRRLLSSATRTGTIICFKTPILYSFLFLRVNHLSVSLYCQNFWSVLTASKYNLLTISVLH